MFTSPLLLQSYRSTKISSRISQVVRVWLEMAHCHVNTRFSHTICGHFVENTPSGVFECSFCHRTCGAEVVRSFHLKITLTDAGGKVYAWSTGQTATELLQISPDDFYGLPEVMFELQTWTGPLSLFLKPLLVQHLNKLSWLVSLLISSFL